MSFYILNGNIDNFSYVCSIVLLSSVMSTLGGHGPHNRNQGHSRFWCVKCPYFKASTWYYIVNYFKHPWYIWPAQDDMRVAYVLMPYMRQAISTYHADECDNTCKNNIIPVDPLQWRHIERDGVSNHQSMDCLLNSLFKRRSKKTSKLRVTGLCKGNSSVTGEFPSHRASNAKNISIWWRNLVSNKDITSYNATERFILSKQWYVIYPFKCWSRIYTGPECWHHWVWRCL